eukprot:gb/GECG01012316.1/.p1 GENE.gb/GECG01012316.1/~~gb/GECG01012316.1/.p1  ORF type:complete len:269 (+),score=50.63 gb/GECG01012316.1/:1-807(+)
MKKKELIRVEEHRRSSIVSHIRLWIALLDRFYTTPWRRESSKEQGGTTASQEAPASGTEGAMSFFQQVTNGMSVSSKTQDIEQLREPDHRRRMNTSEAKAVVDKVMPPERDPSNADEFVIKRFAEYMKYSEQGHNFTENLRSKKEFQNPYILDRVAEHFGLDGENEYASNYPTELFDPQAHGPEDYYDSISYRQQIQEEFRETRKQMEPRSTISFAPSSHGGPAAGDNTQTSTRQSGSGVDKSSVQAATAKARAVAADLMRKQQKQGQ